MTQDPDETFEPRAGPTQDPTQSEPGSGPDPEVPPYRLRVSLVHADPGRLTLALRLVLFNLGTVPLILEDSAPPVRIGILMHRKDGAPYDLRLPSGPRRIDAGGMTEIFGEIALPAETRPGDHFTQIALVHEGLRWLATDDPEQAAHLTISLSDGHAARRAYWRGVLRRAADGEGDGKGDGEGDARTTRVATMLRDHDFSAPVRRLLATARRAMATGRAAGSRHAALFAEPDPGTSAGTLPIDRHLAHFLYRSGRLHIDRPQAVTLEQILETLIDIGQMSVRPENAVTEGSAGPGGPRTPAPDLDPPFDPGADLAALLSREALDPWALGFPVSAAMLWLGRRAGYDGPLSDPDAFADWLVQAVSQACLPAAVLPPALVAMLRQDVIGPGEPMLPRILQARLARRPDVIPGAVPLIQADPETGPGLDAGPDRPDTRHAAVSFDALVRHLRNPVVVPLFGNDMARFWATPVHPDGPSPLAVALWAYADTDIEVTGSPFRAVAIRDWFDTTLRPALPAPWGTAKCTGGHTGGHPPAPGPVASTGHATGPASSATAGPVRLTLAGHPRSQTGLGQNVRMLHEAIGETGLAIDLYDIDQTAVMVRSGAPAAPSAVTVLAANPETLPGLRLHDPSLFEPALVGFFLWEFGVLSPEQHLGVAMMDRIWTPSDFVRDAYATVARCPVSVIPKVIDVGGRRRSPAATSPGRDPEALVFLSAYDQHSGTERKNPLAGVQAFRAAFPADRFPRMRYILKSTDTRPATWGDPDDQDGSIRALAARDPRIDLRTERMPYGAYLDMIAAADCIVSTHRSEGFGYLMAHALAMEVPVIATDYSGNRDFCTPQTAFPVPAREIAARPRDLFLPLRGALWGDVDVAAVAEAMGRVQADPAGAAARARAGRRLVETRYSRAAAAAAIGAELRALGVAMDGSGATGPGS